MPPKKIDIEQLIPRRWQPAEIEPPPSSPRRSEASDTEAESPRPTDAETTIEDKRFPVALIPRAIPGGSVSKKPVTITLPKHDIKPGIVEAIAPKRCKMKDKYIIQTQDCPRPLSLKPVRILPPMNFTPWTQDHPKVKLPVKPNAMTVDVEDMSFASTIPRPLDDREVPEIYVRVVEDTSLLPLKQSLAKRLDWASALPRPNFEVDFPLHPGMEPRMVNLLPAKSIVSWSPASEESCTGNIEDSSAPESDPRGSSAPSLGPAELLMPRKCVMNMERKFGIILPWGSDHEEVKVWKAQSGSSLPRICTS